MSEEYQVRDLLNATAYDANGDKLGTVEDVFINEASKQPDFIKIKSGLFGTNPFMVPLRGHSFDGKRVTLALTKDRVANAPQISENARLEPEDQERLYLYYGLKQTEEPAPNDATRTPVAQLNLRKYTVHETRTITVSHDEVRIERTPIRKEDAASYQATAGDSASIILYADEVSTTPTPVEKITLGRETVQQDRVD